jgi:NAD/NADP octopine/nopaline dehydrogenase, alpha-helical domain
MTDPIRVLICGAGSSAHVLVGVISAKPDVEVRTLTLNATKAHRWQQLLDTAPVKVISRNGGLAQDTLTANYVLITNSPAEAARGCDIILFAVPAFLHWQYLNALKPYIEDGCVIVGLPGQSGFEFEVRKVLDRRVAKCILMNFDSLPWVCRIIEFGRIVQICGTKDKLVGAVQGDLSRVRARDPLGTLQRLLGVRPRLVISGHLLGITLRSPNAYSHPPIMYGRWKNWDGQPLEEPPLFYHDIDEATAELLGEISEEVVETSRRLMKQYPRADLSQVIPMYDWDICCYGNDIKDKTNLLTALKTNSGYADIKHPMIMTEDGRCLPDFNHRFLTEDVPFGLVVVRSIAEIAGVPTPHIDTVLKWCQEKMGNEYLVGSRLTGKDLAETRCAQRYGFTTTDDILGYESTLAAVLPQ